MYRYPYACGLLPRQWRCMVRAISWFIGRVLVLGGSAKVRGDGLGAGDKYVAPEWRACLCDFQWQVLAPGRPSIASNVCREPG